MDIGTEVPGLVGMKMLVQDGDRPVTAKWVVDITSKCQVAHGSRRVLLAYGTIARNWVVQATHCFEGETSGVGEVWHLKAKSMIDDPRFTQFAKQVNIKPAMLLALVFDHSPERTIV